MSSFPRMHVSLYVADMSKTVAFYERFFNVKANKIKSDYAKFILEEPSLIISFVQNADKVGSNFGHLGFQVETQDKLKELMELANANNQVFLEEVGKKSYVLNVYDGAKKKGQVSFKDGVVFTYRPSFPCWQEDSKYQLKIVDLVFNKNVSIIIIEPSDRYGRIIAEVNLADKTNINKAMLAAGMAWHFDQYPGTFIHERLEDKAYGDHLGLWAYPNPVPPWEFRRKK